MVDIKEVETNVEELANTCSKGGDFGKNVLTGAGCAAVVITLYELGKLLAKKIKTKRAGKKLITTFVNTSNDKNEDE